jgi:hypothetical protein
MVLSAQDAVFRRLRSSLACSFEQIIQRLQEQASSHINGFVAAMRRLVDVAVAVAERDYPQLGAGWEACRSHMVTRDGGQTYQFESSYQTVCSQISAKMDPIVRFEFEALNRASEAADRAVIGQALR